MELNNGGVKDLDGRFGAREKSTRGKRCWYAVSQPTPAKRPIEQQMMSTLRIRKPHDSHLLPYLSSTKSEAGVNSSSGYCVPYPTS